MPRKKTETKKMTAKKTDTKKSTKIEEMSQAHGKEEKPLYSTLDQLWGDTGLQKYGTLDETEYSSQLKNMTKSDIQAHANKLGLIPIDNREELEKRLLKEFLQHKTIHTARVPDNLRTSNLEGNLSTEARKILSEGK